MHLIHTYHSGWLRHGIQFHKSSHVTNRMENVNEVSAFSITISFWNPHKVLLGQLYEHPSVVHLSQSAAVCSKYKWPLHSPLPTVCGKTLSLQNRRMLNKTIGCGLVDCLTSDIKTCWCCICRQYTVSAISNISDYLYHAGILKEIVVSSKYIFPCIFPSVELVHKLGSKQTSSSVSLWYT